jgi:hypothetical protein
MTYLIALLFNILNRSFYYGHSNFIYDVLLFTFLFTILNRTSYYSWYAAMTLTTS